MRSNVGRVEAVPREGAASQRNAAVEPLAVEGGRGGDCLVPVRVGGGGGELEDLGTGGLWGGGDAKGGGG